MRLPACLCLRPLSALLFITSVTFGADAVHAQGNGQGQGNAGGGGITPMAEELPPNTPVAKILSIELPAEVPAGEVVIVPVNVKNAGTGAQTFMMDCAGYTVSNQFGCVNVVPENKYLKSNQTFTFMVHLKVGGLGARQLIVQMMSEPSEDSDTAATTVTGIPLVQHVIPMDGSDRAQADTMRAVFTEAIDTASLVVTVGGGAPARVTTATGYKLAPALAGSGSVAWTTYACDFTDRCDGVTTHFAQAGPTAWELDDSLPPPQGHGIEGLLGGIPLPPVERRGCPTAIGYPEIRLSQPTSFLSQPASGGHPGGLVFAASVSMNDTVRIRTLTVDRLETDTITCVNYGYLPRADFNWDFWTGTNINDPFWEEYPYGGLTLHSAPEAFGVPVELALGVQNSGPNAPPESFLRARTHASRPRPSGRLYAGNPITPATLLGGSIPDAGAIKPSTFTLDLNGTRIATGASAPVTGITIDYVERIGASVSVPATHSLLNVYDPAQPSANNGGWNELIASIADSGGRRTYVRTQFVHMGPGTVAPLAMKTTRDFLKRSMGECAAFGPFQCGEVFLTQSIPGFVTRDKPRDLHLVYRSGSQRVPTALPVEIDIQRTQDAPDSLAVVPLVGTTPAGPSIRYAGTKGSVTGAGAALLWEHADETRVVGAEVTAAAIASATIRNIAIAVDQFYAGVVQTDTLQQRIVETALVDSSVTHFGAGWQLAELSRLQLGQMWGTDSAAVLVSGDGSYSVFRKLGATWTPPPGEAARLVKLTTAQRNAYWVLYLDNGASVGFRGDGWQVWSRDLVGNYSDFAYAPSSSRLTTITDPTGRQFVLGYTNAHVTSVDVRPSSGGTSTRMADLAYSTTCTGSGAWACQLTRLILHRSATERDTTRFTYTTDGMQRALIDSVVEPRAIGTARLATRFSFDDATKTPSQAVLPNGGVLHYRSALRRALPRDGYGRGNDPLERMIYPNQLRGTAVGVRGFATDFQADRFGFPTWVRRVSSGQGGGGMYIPGSAADDIRRIERDTLGRVTKIVAGNPIATMPDSAMFYYDALSRVTRIDRTSLAWPAPTPAYDSLLFTWDSVTLAANGAWCSRLRSSRDPMERVTTINYGSTGLGRCAPTQVIEPGGATSSFAYGAFTTGTPSAGRPTSTTDAAGLTQSVTYASGTWNTTTHTSPAAGTTTAFLNSLGRLDSVSNALGVKTRFVNDRLGRVLASKTGTGSLAPTTRIFYGHGGLVDSTHIYASADNTLLVPQGGDIQKTRNFYDRAGALDSLIGPGARSGGGHIARKQSWLHDAGGLPVYAFPGNGSFTATIHDWQGRPSIRYISHVGLMAADGERFADPATEAAYDSLQFSVGPKLSAGQRLEYYYNNRGQVELSAAHDEFLGDMAIVHRYGYSPSGALTGDTLEFSDGAKVERYFTYNRLGQRLQVRDTVVMSSGQGIAGDRGGYTRYTYEPTTGRLSSIVGLVRLSSTLLDTMARVTFVYDTSGRETLRTTYLDGHSMVITRQTAYDAAGRASSMTHKSGSTVRYAFSSPTWSSIGELRTATENRRGLTGIARFNYDSTSWTRRLVKSVDGPSGHTYQWTYDGFGNRVEENHTVPGGSGCSPHYESEYGPDNRLLVANQGVGGCTPYRRFLTDQAGQRLATFRDSLSGYLGLESAQTYTAAGQLYFALTPQGPAGPWNFVWNWYDAEGRRAIAHLADASNVLKAGPDSAWGHRTYYVYDGTDVAFTLMKPAGSTGWRIQQRYLITGLDEAVAARLWLDGSQQNLGIISDRQGGFLLAVRPDGLEETRTGFYLRNPFGAMDGGDAADASDKHTGLGFTGAGDPTASGGYTYLRNRWYDPATGRFLTQDPIGLAGGTNLYAYAGNNPVAYADPYGLCASGPDSIQVEVTVDCGDGTTSTKKVWARRATNSESAAVVQSASRLTGGDGTYTPSLVQTGYQILASARSIYAFPMKADGYPIMQGARTETGGGNPPYTAFREDAFQAIVSGNLGAPIGNIGFNAAEILGHEGAHLWGSHHPQTYSIPWGFKP